MSEDEMEELVDRDNALFNEEFNDPDPSIQ